MFMKYGSFMFAPDTGSDGEANASATVVTEVDNTDYKALYEKEVAERAKLKKTFDATASEVAELKKQSKAKMSEEEKREAELEKERKYWQAMANELNEIKVANIFAKQGYDEKDYSDLSKKLVEVGGANAAELADSFVEFVRKATKNAVASAKNGMIKDGAIPPKTGSLQDDKPKYAQMATETNKNNSNSQNIKDYYKKKN